MKEQSFCTPGNTFMGRIRGNFTTSERNIATGAQKAK